MKKNMKKIAQKILNSNKQLFFYILIGLSAVFIDFIVFSILNKIFLVTPSLSTIFSVLAATFYSFGLNSVKNFKTTDFVLFRMFLFFIVSLLGMVASVLIISFFINHGLDPVIAKAISLPPIVIFQYFANSRITFAKKTGFFKKVLENKIEKETELKTSNLDKENMVQLKNKHIAIVGGGFTGLSTAYYLAKKGYQVTILEKEKEVGGLVSGFELEGIPLEKAYHFLYKTDKDIIDLANEIGVGDKLSFYASSLSLFYDGHLYPFMTPMDLLRFTPLSFFDRIRAGVIALYLSKVKNWHSFAKISAYKWMLRYAGKKITKVIWEPILRGKFFDYFDKIAMSYVWSRVYVRANSKDKGDVTEKLGYFKGGWIVFIDALVSKCKELGVNILTGIELESIKEIEGKVLVSGKNNFRESFDSCVATISTNVFSKLISGDTRVGPEYIAKLNSIDYLGAVTMVFTLKKEITKYYWHNVNDPSVPFLVMLSLSSLIGEENLNGKHISYIGAYVPHDHPYFSYTDEQIFDLWFGGLKKIFPDIEKTDIVSSRIFRLKYAQHIVDVNYQDKIPPYRSILPGVYLANFSQIFPDDRGTNYAILEGKKMAEMIDADFGHIN